MPAGALGETIRMHGSSDVLQQIHTYHRPAVMLHAGIDTEAALPSPRIHAKMCRSPDKILAAVSSAILVNPLDQSSLDPSGSITSLVNRISAGDLVSGDDLFPVVYAELRALAGARLGREGMAAQIAPTDLVHLVYVKLFGRGVTPEDARPAHGSVRPPCAWQNRAHFFGSAARAMEQILVDTARRTQTERRRLGKRMGDGGERAGFDLDSLPGPVGVHQDNVDVLLLAEALRELEKMDAPLADLVRLRVYLGQPVEAIAQNRGVSPRTVHRDWALARAWLSQRMKRMGIR